jgi:filamentous hemagglutinin
MDEQKQIYKQNDKDQNNYATNFGEDVSFYTSNALDQTYDADLATTNNHNSGQVTSLSSIFNDNTMVNNSNHFNNNVDVGDGDDRVYIYNNQVVATDGINDKKVIELTTKETIEKGLYNNAYQKGQIKTIAQEDTTKYENVFNLENENDFQTLQQNTDMNYDSINKNTNIVYWNGMDNTKTQAQQTQNLIQKDFPNTTVGLINNQTGDLISPLNIIQDFFEWKPNTLKTKDLLNAHQLQQLSPNTLLVTHSAGNEDIHKANQVNALVNAKTPYQQVSVGSPKSKTDLENSASKVGAKVITQINHPNDPVTIPNGDADYEMKENPLSDINKFHKFNDYYNKEGLKEEIEKNNKEQGNE